VNLPNTLTLLRIFFVPLLVAVLVQGSVSFHAGPLLVTNEIVAIAIFLIAAATDLLDGYLARRWGQITTVGTLLDPIADKLLVSAALISLVQVRVVPAWMVVVVIGREFAISGLRSIAAAEGYVIKASDLGKTKLVSQVIAVTMLILSIRWIELRPYALAAMWIVVAFTLASAFAYFRKFWRKIDDQVKRRRRRELLVQRKQKLRRAAESNSGAGASLPLRGIKSPK
jgi:CDP-diacylglycerol---glycerol-3-phosphate 3-phosphatidyltransferase